MGERIPTTEDIRNWATWVPETTVGMKISQRAVASFAAWLAAHDREVQAQALREAADEVHVEARWAIESRRSGRVYYPVKRLLEVETVLRERADRIASP